MAYYVSVGSTDPPAPARTFDRVDDEDLAIEIVRVLQERHPGSWATILPTTPRPGLIATTHETLVAEAQDAYERRDERLREQADAVRQEALRRLGRLVDESPPEVEPERPRGRRWRSRGRRRAERVEDAAAVAAAELLHPAEPEPAPPATQREAGDAASIESPPPVEAAGEPERVPAAPPAPAAPPEPAEPSGPPASKPPESKPPEPPSPESKRPEQDAAIDEPGAAEFRERIAAYTRDDPLEPEDVPADLPDPRGETG